MNTRLPLADYLALDYPFQAIADPDGGYVILFPDLPGCMTQVDAIEEIGPMAAEIKELWIETEYEQGHEIPLPSYPEEYSGKFNLRLPKSLHRRLAEGAARDDVSLNQHAVALLSNGMANADVAAALRAILEGQERLHGEVAHLATSVDEIRSHMTTYSVEHEARSQKRRHPLALVPADEARGGAVAA